MCLWCDKPRASLVSAVRRGPGLAGTPERAAERGAEGRHRGEASPISALAGQGSIAGLQRLRPVRPPPLGLPGSGCCVPAKILANGGVAGTPGGSGKTQARPSGAGPASRSEAGPFSCGCEAAMSLACAARRNFRIPHPSRMARVERTGRRSDVRPGPRGWIRQHTLSRLLGHGSPRRADRSHESVLVRGKLDEGARALRHRLRHRVGPW